MKFILTLVAIALLTACGGGGDGGSFAYPPPKPDCGVALVKLDGGPAACAPEA